jgi:Leucine-rich repeat (LRR) protein
MKTYLAIFLSFLFFSAVKAQNGPISKADLAKYPTYRNIKKHPIDSTYRLTLENVHEIPADIDRYKHLQRLTIFGNDWDADLSSIPGSLYDCENLSYLSIANTDISSLGSGIKNLKYLDYLSVANNKLVSLPKALGGIEELSTLVIDNNIREIPVIPSLEDLSIYFQTNLGEDSGTIPEGINGLEYCRTLRLYSEDTKINIPKMMAIIFDMQSIENITFIDPNITAEEISSLKVLRNIKEINLTTLQFPADVFKGFDNLIRLSFGKYLESDTAVRHKFWDNIISLPKLEEVTTTFCLSDTNYYKRMKKINLVLDPSLVFTEQFVALKNNANLYRIEFPSTSNIPLSLKILRTVKEIDFTNVNSQDFTIVFGCLQEVPSLEKIIVSNDQFLTFPPETARLKKLKEMYIYNIQHGSFDVISEAQKRKAEKMLPNCKFTYEE